MQHNTDWQLLKCSGKFVMICFANIFPFNVTFVKPPLCVASYNGFCLLTSLEMMGENVFVCVHQIGQKWHRQSHQVITF